MAKQAKKSNAISFWEHVAAGMNITDETSHDQLLQKYMV